MLRIYACLLLLIGSSAVAGSQSIITLSGRVTDDQSKAVAGASVSLLNTGAGTLTNKQGAFILTNLPAGSYILQVTAVGFAAITREINEKETGNITVVLSPASIHLDEVVVSAQKKEELIWQLPFSLTAITAKKAEQYRLWTARDMTAIVPNLFAANPGDGRNVVAVRGITSTSYDPAVTTYVDGVNQFSLDTYIPQLFDIERIEVLRGPQGTLYGRNAMGGVINIITRKPSDKASGFITLNAGNYGRQRYGFGLRGPLVQHKLFAGAALVYDRRNGYYTNEHTQASFDRQNSLTGNYYLAYVPSSLWKLTLNIKHDQNRNNGAFPLVNGISDALAHPFLLNQNAVSKMVDNTFNASFSINYTGTGFSFASQTAWQTNRRYYRTPLDGDFSPIDGVTIINRYGGRWNKVNVLTQEFRFTSPAAATWQWTTGLYLFHQTIPNKQATHFGNDADLVGAPDKNFSLINTSRGKSSGVAAYGQTSYALTKKLNITAGMRYDLEYKRQQVLGEYQKDPDPTPLFATQPDTSASTRFSAFSPRLSADYRFSFATHAYLTYSRGYRTGGFTQLSSDPSQPPLYRYKPEFSNNYEAGVKSTFSRLYLAVACFHTSITQAQVPTLILPDAVTVTKNAGRLQTSGIEFEALAKPAKGWEIDYNFGYTHAEYKKLKLPQGGMEWDYSGNRQVFTPAITSFLATQYGIALSARSNTQFIFRGEWAVLGKQYFDLANTILQPAYHLLHTRFGMSAKQWELMLWVRNLTGKKYIAYAYDFGAVHLGDPRTYGITITARF